MSLMSMLKCWIVFVGTVDQGRRENWCKQKQPRNFHELLKTSVDVHHAAMVYKHCTNMWEPTQEKKQINKHHSHLQIKNCSRCAQRLKRFYVDADTSWWASSSPSASPSAATTSPSTASVANENVNIYIRKWKVNIGISWVPSACACAAVSLLSAWSSPAPPSSC